jgi:hypothetical protein
MIEHSACEVAVETEQRARKQSEAIVNKMDMPNPNRQNHLKKTPT